jgi:hypothetical protein
MRDWTHLIAHADEPDVFQAALALIVYAGDDDDRDDEEVIADLVTDLLHVAASRGVDPQEVLRRVGRDAEAEGVFDEPEERS